MAGWARAHPAILSRRDPWNIGRVAIALTLVVLVILGSVAFAYANTPSALPVEPDGGIAN